MELAVATTGGARGGSAAGPALGEWESEEDEELVDLPEAEKRADPLHEARISRAIDGVDFTGFVEDIEVGKVTGDRLYRIRYSDGDLEHFTAQQVRESLVGPEPAEPQDAAVLLKRPAGAAAGVAPGATDEEEPVVSKRPAAADSAEELASAVAAAQEEEPVVSKKPAAADAEELGAYKKPAAAAAEEEASAVFKKPAAAAAGPVQRAIEKKPAGAKAKAKAAPKKKPAAK